MRSGHALCLLLAVPVTAGCGDARRTAARPDGGGEPGVDGTLAPPADPAAARRIAEENLLRYNGMLIGVFELLADARAQVASATQAIEAEREFWRAEATLKASLLGQPVAPLALQAGAAPEPAGGGH